MSTVISEISSSKRTADSTPLANWWPILAGLLVLYVPTYIELANTTRDGDDNVYPLIVLTVTMWIFWRDRSVLARQNTIDNPIVGTLLLFIGLTLYVFGRALGIQLFEAGSQLPVAASLLLIVYGWTVLRRLWFPVLFLLFTVPLPGLIVNELTGVLKQHVSLNVEQILYAAGYPVARNGVTLTIGAYQLLVANACSGLNSMFSLSATGILYVYLSHHSNWVRNFLLLALVVPVAFCANIVRVIALLLITYYFGNDAGQGFLHDFSSACLFATAVIILLGMDTFLGLLFRRLAHEVSSA